MSLSRAAARVARATLHWPLASSGPLSLCLVTHCRHPTRGREKSLEQHMGEVCRQSLEDAHMPFYGLKPNHLATPYNKYT